VKHQTRPEPGASLRAVVGLLLGAGALAGLADALAATARGLTANAGAVALHAMSFAAALALALGLPVVFAMAVTGRPRSNGRRLGLGLALLAAGPAGLVLARDMHTRIPWGGTDLAGGAAALAAIAVGVALLTELRARVLGPRAGRWARASARLAPWLGIVLVPAALSVARAIRSAASPPGGSHETSLLLLTVDTLRSDHLGVAGDPRARTRWMDRVARTGVLHEVCVTPSPWTLPSLASLHTGTSPGRHRVLEEVSGLAADVPTLAECCKSAGLRTAAFVSNPWLATRSLARGFDRFDVAERPALLDPIRGTRLSVAATKALLRLSKLDDGVRLTRKAAAWLRDGEGAFFLWVHWFDPHLPNWPAFPFDRLDGPAPRLVPASLTVEAIRAGDFAGGDEGRQEIARLYRGEVAYTDRAIGMQNTTNHPILCQQ
jgi:hypothetical protein